MDINQKRNYIRNELFRLSRTIKSGKLERVADEDLSILFQLYDAIFLNDYFKNNYKGKLIFKFSRRLKSSAGITKCQKNLSALPPENYSFEINISADFLFDYYRVDREIEVNGYQTKDSLDALLLVFEHELCHVMENIQYQTSSCRGKRFYTMANTIFGHTGVTHALPTNFEINRLNYKVKVGDSVNFTFEDKKMFGIIHKINKRATVMVENKKGRYVDKYGKRYQKYYVPLDIIQNVY